MECDFLVIGGGIAGASAASELAAAGRVVLVEAEAAPGYHSTGRAAANFSTTEGNRVIRLLALASHPFLASPPPGFCEGPLITPRGILYVARRHRRHAFEAALALARETAPAVREVSVTEAMGLLPVLDPDYVAHVFHQPDAMDLDANALHQGFLKRLRLRGGTLLTNAEVTRLARRRGRWHASTGAGEVRAAVVVNAAGAWADEVAQRAGVTPLGLVPKRRTAILFDGPPGVDTSAWAEADDVDEAFYLKPEAGRVLASPADETPVVPSDVQADELDVALAIDRVERATTMKVGRIVHKWAGLRSFVADRSPVVGMAADADGFFWLAGQGGAGIMTSPAMAQAAAALITGMAWPERLTALGVAPADLAPERLRAAADSTPA